MAGGVKPFIVDFPLSVIDILSERMLISRMPGIDISAKLRIYQCAIIKLVHYLSYPRIKFVRMTHQHHEASFYHLFQQS